jgi:hypothetical protein
MSQQPKESYEHLLSPKMKRESLTMEMVVRGAHESINKGLTFEAWSTSVKEIWHASDTLVEFVRHQLMTYNEEAEY